MPNGNESTDAEEGKLILEGIRFFRIKTPRGNRIVRLVRENPERNSGIRVNMDGSRWEHSTSDTDMIEMLLFTDGDIIEELVLDLHYGELIPRSEVSARCP